MRPVRHRARSHCPQALPHRMARRMHARASLATSRDFARAARHTPAGGVRVKRAARAACACDQALAPPPLPQPERRWHRSGARPAARFGMRDPGDRAAPASRSGRCGSCRRAACRRVRRPRSRLGLSRERSGHPHPIRAGQTPPHRCGSATRPAPRACAPIRAS